MTIVADISMSLDGFVTGPNAGLHNGLGDGGEPLHTWAVDSTEQSASELRANAPAAG